MHPVRRNGEERANHEKAFGVVYYESRGSGCNSDSVVAEWYFGGMSVRGDVKLASNRWSDNHSVSFFWILAPISMPRGL